jgi:hypothetical protein
MERWRRQSLRRITQLAAVLLASLSAGSTIEAAQLQPDTAIAWDAYVRATEARLGRELAAPGESLVNDSPPSASAEGAAPKVGDIQVVKMAPAGSPLIAVPGGTIHHWRGRVLLPGATLRDVMVRLANPSPRETEHDDVLASRVLERGPGSLRLFLRLQRSQIVTVVYDTEHEIQFVQHDARRASSRSVATRIVEVADAGTAQERALAMGRDRGFLWRLNSYWRYEQAARGVVVECESLSLSRGVPTLLAGAISPIIDLVARGSMERTLSAMRRRFATSAGGRR